VPTPLQCVVLFQCGKQIGVVITDWMRIKFN
jgi:hypothetical protein